ncbi:MAG: hypothetical protein GF307_14395 [candidate division Zixibacteria bacterium]|nr:hypothetical protein [candidate division Zixibacteria bacterium]
MNSKNNSQSIDLREYANILMKRKTLLIFPLIITVLTVMAASYFISPVYQSSTTILVAESSLLAPAFERIMPGEGNRMNRDQRNERLNTIRNQIMSSSHLSILIRRLNIPISDNIKETVTNLHRQFPEISELELAQKIQIEQIRERISVGFKGSNLVQISAEAESPVMAADMAKTLAQIYIDESLASELVGVKGAMDFADEMLAVYKERLDQSETALRRFEQSQLKRNVEQDTSIARNLSEIKSAIDATDLEIRTLEKSIDEIRTELVKGGIRSPQIDYSRDLTDKKFELLNGIGELTDLLAKYSWRDAKVVNVNQLARQRLESIEAEVNNLSIQQYPNLSTYQRQKIADLEYQTIRLSFMREKLTVLNSAVDEVKDIVAMDPALRQRHNQLQREVTENRRVYELFSEQLTGSQINQAATRAEAETKFKIIEPAAIPTAPIRPNRVKLAGIGAVLGFALGLGGILLVEFMDNSFHKVEEVESYLGLRVIGTIPRMETPFAYKGSGRVWVFAGTAVSLLLLAFVIFMSRQS